MTKLKLRSRYILLIASLHLVVLVLTFFIFDENKLLFIGSEAVLLVSAYFFFRLYKALVAPVQLISKGVNAILDRDFQVKFQEIGQPEMDHLIQVYNRMIDELRQERTQTVEKNLLLEKLIRSSPTGIIQLDLEGRISSCNPRAVAMLKMNEKDLIGKSPDEWEAPLLKALSKLEKDASCTIRINGIETYKCHKSHFIDRGFPNYYLQIEELTAEKLEIEKKAYGNVIRMMAHEVNNSIGPVNSILDSLGVYGRELPEEIRKEFSDAIQIARERNLKLNQFMVNFADVVRLPAPLPEWTDLPEMIRRVARFMSFETGGKEIRFQLDLPEDPIRVSLDVRQMEQVLINILKNSIEAIEKTGDIRIGLKRNPVRLEIIDTGPGIPPDKEQEVFAYFFSTKSGGQGVGLILVREILINHGFGFSLSTNGESGAVFRIEFERANR